MSEPTYELPTNDLSGSFGQFDENQKCLARITVARYVEDDLGRAEMFDTLDIWPEITGS
jgi:hypothetical protein